MDIQVKIGPGPAPSKIILAFWPQASETFVEYYINGYRDIFSHAQVFVLDSTDQCIDTIMATYMTEKQAGHAPADDTLIHIFGDDAAANVTNLFHTYHTHTDAVLPVGTIISDLAPSRFILVTSAFHNLAHNPLSTLYLLFHLIIYTTILDLLAYLLHLLHPFAPQPLQLPSHNSKSRSRPTTDQIWTALNTLIPPEVRRMYCLPKQIILWEPRETIQDDEEMDITGGGVADEGMVSLDLVLERSKIGPRSGSAAGDGRRGDEAQERWWGAVAATWIGVVRG